MDNDEIRKNFVDSINANLFQSKESSNVESELNYYYIGSFIRLHNFDYYNNLLKCYGAQIIDYLNKYGNIPSFFYEFRRKLEEYRRIKHFMEEEKSKIIDELELFYGKNSSAIDKFRYIKNNINY